MPRKKRRRRLATPLPGAFFIAGCGVVLRGAGIGAPVSSLRGLLRFGVWNRRFRGRRTHRAPVGPPQWEHA